MRSKYVILCALIGSITLGSCGKKKKHGSVTATLMKSKTVSSNLTELSSTSLMADSGSMVQSFTPSSLKIPIFRVNLCQGSSKCSALYTCSANTVAGCSVELAKIDEFVDALNASPQQLEDGTTFDHIGVQFCPDGDTSGIQHLTVNGTVKIQGVDYATDPTSGLVSGTTGKDSAIDVKGGCASFYPVTPAVTVSKNNPATVKMFFDASLFAYGGLSGGASNTNSYNSSGSCIGDSSKYVCAQVVTVVATIDSGTPTAEHYLIANTDSSRGGSTDSAATASVVLYFLSDGTPIGGVQNAYRVSGASTSWGLSMNGGLGLYPKVVNDTTVSFGEPEGSVSLADWFKNFSRSSHSGTYTYNASGNVATESTYKATKL